MLDKDSVKRVVIVGGGTAGWMAAAALSKILGKHINITLIESDDIGTVGVGEATIPTMLTFHRLLEIDEREFLRATNGTFKLGILFENWSSLGESYIHSFGKTGREFWGGEFQHFWLGGRKVGVSEPFGDYCLELQAAKAGKFAISRNPWTNYAYHLDATAYAKHLRKFSEGYGVKRIEGMIEKIKLNEDSGFIEAIILKSGQVIEGDLFIDCSGFRGLLIEQTMHTGYEDWSHWLPCDSAIAVQTESVSEPVPYTRSSAHQSGWQWRIPLQHRVGNGLVYCSSYQNDEDAKQTLLNNLEGKVLTEPRLIKFRTGRRLKSWNKNCIALGLATGFIEPLESTSIHLISSGLIRLLRLFPLGGIRQIEIDEYNRQTSVEIENVRDFIILHYYATQRVDSPFWHHCRTMTIPDSLAHRINLFKETGRIFIGSDELFRVDSWTQVMIGQGIIPEQYHPTVHDMSDEELTRFLSRERMQINEMVAKLPSHQEFINSYLGKK
jgi:tryptophan 7-halogenase